MPTVYHRWHGEGGGEWGKGILLSLTPPPLVQMEWGLGLALLLSRPQGQVSCALPTWVSSTALPKQSLRASSPPQSAAAAQGKDQLSHSQDLRASSPTATGSEGQGCRASLPCPLHRIADERWGQISHACSWGQITCAHLDRISSIVLPRRGARPPVSSVAAGEEQDQLSRVCDPRTSFLPARW